MGTSRKAAAEMAGFSVSYAQQLEGKQAKGLTRNERLGQTLPPPIPFDRLCPEALRGLEDFEFYRRFYLGHISTPWQVETAERIVDLIASPDKEFLDENAPPGVGKTTLMHDIACWLTTRDRRLRGLLGSRTENNGKRMLSRIRRSLERPTPALAPSEAIERGLAVDARASLAQHYGVFRPTISKDVWRAEEFIVAQFDDIPIEEKEPTWSAYGLDSGVLSNRFDVIIWDDLIDRKTNRTADTREALVQKWDEELETRLEPGGLLVIVGQRLHAEDLYATLRDRTVAVDVDDEDGETRKMYHHIVYPAHDDTKCVNIHKPQEAKPWPDGCLLDPYRLPWTECKRLMGKHHIWPVVYQQTDGDPTERFVHPNWITGDNEHPGCWDVERRMGTIPSLQGRTLSIATCDPSPTKYWSVQWWLYHPDSEQRFLLDLHREQMEAPEFFDYNPVDHTYSGLLVDWQERSKMLGKPITHWIVERNAAQRFMLQTAAMRTYRAKMRFTLIPHETTMNKSDEKYGVQSIASHYEYGRVRLPGSRLDHSRVKSMRLVDELVRWPEGSTDDCVMANWFLEWNLPKIVAPDRSSWPTMKRPSWFKELVS